MIRFFLILKFFLDIVFKIIIIMIKVMYEDYC